MAINKDNMDNERELQSYPWNKEKEIPYFSKPFVPTRGIQASETEESVMNHRLGKIRTVILEKNRRGNYLIVEGEGMTYLIPSDNLRVNQHKIGIIENIFECRNYNPSYSSNFQVIQPAIVNSISSGESWELYQRGILQF